MRPLSNVSVLFLVFSGVFIGCGKGTAPHGGSVLYRVERTASPPVVDGILEDACWKDVPALEFVRAQDGGKSRQPTSLRMLYDGDCLYLAFECQDPDAASDVMQSDGPVDEQDCVAFLADAGSGGAGYFMIAAAPTGAVYDAWVLNHGNGAAVKMLSSWNCEKLRASVVVYGGGAQPGNEDRFWTVEMAVPFAQILTAAHIPPEAGDEWRANFFRLDSTGGRELTAASAVGAPDMHRPASFANIVFGESREPGKRSHRPARAGYRRMASSDRSLRP